MKRFQNQVTESRLTLPLVLLYGVAVWLAAGLINHQWWIQFLCFAASTLVMMELNNSHALIRIYSRVVSATFICLTCSACFLFSSQNGNIALLCLTGSLLTLFHCYQDKLSTGWTFYTFTLLGLSSLVYVQTFWLVPVYWLIMFNLIYSMSGRTFAASLLGVLLPYWMAVCWILVGQDGDFTALGEHLLRLGTYQLPYHYETLTTGQILVFTLTTSMTLTGIIHYLRTSSRDNIRVRQLFLSLMLLFLVSAIILVVQPQHYDLLIRVMIITGSPLIGHFISLTSTRYTNAGFYMMIAGILITTLYNLWM